MSQQNFWHNHKKEKKIWVNTFIWQFENSSLFVFEWGMFLFQRSSCLWFSPSIWEEQECGSVTRGIWGMYAHRSSIMICNWQKQWVKMPPMKSMWFIAILWQVVHSKLANHLLSRIGIGLRYCLMVALDWHITLVMWKSVILLNEWFHNSIVIDIPSKMCHSGS